jgi:hypothetical protein
MCIFKWADKKIKKMKMKWYDVSLVKLSVMFATLFLITAWAGFRNFVLGFGWYWYLLITLVLMAPLLKKMFYD